MTETSDGYSERRVTATQRDKSLRLEEISDGDSERQVTETRDRDKRRDTRDE